MWENKWGSGWNLANIVSCFQILENFVHESDCNSKVILFNFCSRQIFRGSGAKHVSNWSGCFAMHCLYEKGSPTIQPKVHMQSLSSMSNHIYSAIFPICQSNNLFSVFIGTLLAANTMVFSAQVFVSFSLRVCRKLSLNCQFPQRASDNLFVAADEGTLQFKVGGHDNIQDFSSPLAIKNIQFRNDYRFQDSIRRFIINQYNQ